jgi:endoglucanase
MYTAQAGKLYDGAGAEVVLRGISHQGFNSPILQPQFLWKMGWKEQIAQIKSLGFNAVRLPFVPDTLYATTTVDKLSYVEPNLNADLIGKTPLQALDLWMAEAYKQGLYVLLDFHSVSKVRQNQVWYVDNPADFPIIYNNAAYTEANWIQDLTFVAKRYAGLSNLIGLDIYNEPNGNARWTSGDANAPNPANFWKSAAEAAATAVLAANPNLLIFVQGCGANFDGKEDSSIAMNWGEDFQPQAYAPLAIPANKLVLCPHTYGPDVSVKPSFSAPNFPANLAKDWDTLFGQFYPAHPVIVGEWGGRYGTGLPADKAWQDAFVAYLLSKGIHSSFYWCYTPNSGDTGGILADDLTVRADKMALLNKLWAASPASTPVPAPPATPPTATTTSAPIPLSDGQTVTIGGVSYKASVSLTRA